MDAIDNIEAQAADGKRLDVNLLTQLCRIRELLAGSHTPVDEEADQLLGRVEMALAGIEGKQAV